MILGPGFCGKTVLLNIISGLEEAIDGSVKLDGETCEAATHVLAWSFSAWRCCPGKP